MWKHGNTKLWFCSHVGKKNIPIFGETNDVSLTLALLTKRSSYDTTAIVRSLTPRRSDLKA